jgi:hypothetical protein
MPRSPGAHRAQDSETSIEVAATRSGVPGLSSGVESLELVFGKGDDLDAAACK